MVDTVSWTIVALAFVALPIFAVPAVSRAIREQAERASEWVSAREARKSALDPEQEKLWQWTKRRRLCAALDRIERLMATDSWMSATRQLGNRLAYQQLLTELRRTPDVFPAGLDLTAGPTWTPARSTRRWAQPRPDVWDDRDFAVGWSVSAPVAAAFTSSTSQPGSVEVIEIGWRRR
jgi:hypothetical protein